LPQQRKIINRFNQNKIGKSSDLLPILFWLLHVVLYSCIIKKCTLQFLSTIREKGGYIMTTALGTATSTSASESIQEKLKKLQEIVHGISALAVFSTESPFKEELLGLCEEKIASAEKKIELLEQDCPPDLHGDIAIIKSEIQEASAVVADIISGHFS
jgi:hypothetical protein